ncbi:MAG: archease [Candidatus Brocadiia bacterium]
MAAEPREDGGHDTFEHTADVGIRAWGSDLTELFEQAAAGLIEMLLNPGTVEPEQSRPVEVAGDSPEDMLVSWLEELLFAFEAEEFAPADARVDSLADAALRGTIRGEPLDRSRHELRSAVKAVTYHDLTIRETGAGYEVRIVLDV